MDAGVSPSAGILVLPDGTKLPNVDGVHQVSSQASHTGPNSPWSLLTVHVLPLFAGSPLKTPIEDLNSLCNQHIVVMSQRAPTSRLVSIFTNDLREFIASGMLTLKAKFEALEDAKVVSRTAEVWNFFWGQILPYVEGVFLPFSQVRDMPTTAASAAAAHQYAPIISLSPIPVRRILLSAFLVHILLPLLPRLMLLLSYRPDPKHRATDLPRLLQMSLVLSTQARYTTFHPARDMFEGEARDEHTRDAVEDLGRATRWSLAVLSGKLPLHEDDVYTEYTEYTEYAEYAHANSTPATAAGAQPATAVASTPVHPVHPGLQRGPSVSQAGRVRMRGNSVSNAAAQAREPSQSKRPPAWDGRIDEDDDELTHPRAFGSGGGGLGSTAHSTVRAAESFATLTERTPQGGADRMRTHAQGYSHGNSGQSHGLVHRRELSSGESDLTSASSIFRRKH
jgi:hypothetical protein